jgi:hypothetical protein
LESLDKREKTGAESRKGVCEKVRKNISPRFPGAKTSENEPKCKICLFLHGKKGFSPVSLVIYEKNALQRGRGWAIISKETALRSDQGRRRPPEPAGIAWAAWFRYV